ncbi:MAG TPA: LptF/LptG family permease [Fimbriimonadaceae bacterium]|nr:LptF/LptG family permease [Fimbriimonadaceae bacterium]
MSRLDRLIYRELFGPWVFGVAIFTALIFASVLLVRITDWVVKGASADLVFQLVMLLLPGIVVKTFSMALLLASLLAFGRLSNDSEIVAIRASGASLFRVMRPVFLFGLLVSILSFGVNELVVPGASYRATELQGTIRQDLGNAREARPIYHTIFEDGKMVAFVGAKNIDLASQTLQQAFVVVYNDQGLESHVLFANELNYRGEKDWRIIGGGKILPLDGRDVVVLNGDVWPAGVPKMNVTIRNLLAGIASDLDAFSIDQIAAEIRTMRRDPNPDRRQLANLEFGFYNKIALPLSVVVFALLGAPLGIRSHRAGVASGFALSIALSFAYLIIVNFMAVYSKAGQIPPWLASFTPVVIGLVAAAWTIYKKNS